MGSPPISHETHVPRLWVSSGSDFTDVEYILSFEGQRDPVACSGHQPAPCLWQPQHRCCSGSRGTLPLVVGWDPKALTSREHIKDQIWAGEQGRWPGVGVQLREAVPGQRAVLGWVGGMPTEPIPSSCPAGGCVLSRWHWGRGRNIMSWAVALGLTGSTERPGSRQDCACCLQLTLPQAEPRQEWLGFCPRSFSTRIPSSSRTVWLLGSQPFLQLFFF